MFRSLGRFAVRRRWAVIVVWALLCLASVPFAPQVHQVLQPGGFANPNTQGAQGLQLLHQELGATLSSVTLVFSHPDKRATDPDYAAEVNRILTSLASHPKARQIVGLGSTGAGRFISKDGHTTYAGIGLDATTPEAQRLMPELRALLPQTWLQVWITGGPAAYADIELVSQRDLARSEAVSFPLALLSLLVVFGSVVAAGMPVLVGGVAVAVTLTLVYLIAQFAEMSIFVQNLATMLGLGISIDYALLIITRYREELQHHDVEEAVARTIDTAGRAVFFSGVTVFLGLAGLLLFDYVMLRSIGVGGCLVVALSVLGSLTLLPALLAVVGRRIDALPVPLLSRLAHRTDRTNAGGFWAKLAGGVSRRPGLVFLGVLALLLSLGAPFLRVRMGAPDVTILPADVESRQGFDLLRREFGAGEIAPTLIVVQAASGDILNQDNVGALYDYARALEKLPGVVRTESIVSIDPGLQKAQYQFLYRNPASIADPAVRAQLDLLAKNSVALVSVVTTYNPITDEASALVRTIRGIGPGAGLKAYVGGAAAELMDVVNDLYTVFPRTLLVIVVSTYLALLVLFRSVVLPAKAVLMDTLSILASYGALVIIFQDGHFAELLHFQPEGFVDATVPIVMFCVLFGLSMDYEVFMLSRVKEAYERTGDNAAAVAEGLQRTGGIITSAALIIVIVAGSFAFADIIVVKALGIGMALSIFIDATVVRALLVPATMHLLGRVNWWAPAWLRGKPPVA